MLNKKNIFYFLQFVFGCLLTFIGMYLIIFPNFKNAETVHYHKLEYTLLLLYLPTFIFHIIGYVLMNSYHENGISARKKIVAILFVTLFIAFSIVIDIIYLIFKKFPIPFGIYTIFMFAFIGYLIFLTIKTFTQKEDSHATYTQITMDMQ